MFGLRHKERLDMGKARLIYVASFLMGLGSALVMYTASTYFSVAWNTENVGLIYVVLHIGNLVFLLTFHHVMATFGKNVTLLFLLIVEILMALGLSIFPVSIPSTLLLMVFLIAYVLIWIVLDSLLENFSIDAQSGRIRGVYLASMNAGLLIGPLLSATLIASYGYGGLFATVVIFFSLLFLLALIVFRHDDHRFKRRLSIRKAFRKARKHPDLLSIYGISFALDFFYAILIVYTPIHLLQMGMPWSDIGIILSLALIPFIVIEYPVGHLADKRYGEKEMIVTALGVMALALSFMPHIHEPNVFLWGLVLVIGRIAAAFLEVLRDSYFYKKIDGDSIELVTLFRTSFPVASIIAALLSAIFLLFYPLAYIFFLPLIVSVLAFIPALRLRDNHVYNG